MRLNIRLDNDRYLDFKIDVADRIIQFISPVPEITREELQAIADEYSYTIYLNITNEIVKPKNKILDYEFELLENFSTCDKLSVILSIVNYITTEEK